MTEPKPHEACSCSRTRKCAFHTGQIKQMEKVASRVIETQKVEMGIEDLRAKYAKSEKPRTPTQKPRRQNPSRWYNP